MFDLFKKNVHFPIKKSFTFLTIESYDIEQTKFQNFK